MQELLRLKEEGALKGPQALWLRDTRPPEELYDTRSDPFEINNLAGDPGHHKTLVRLREALDGWMEDIDDMGDIPEDRMVEQMWPNGKQPTTHAPFILRRNSIAVDPLENVVSDEPLTVILYCPTHGASLGYTTDPGDSPHWQIYTGPITIPPGHTTLRAKAIRYGYKESPVSVAHFTVHG